MSKFKSKFLVWFHHDNVTKVVPKFNRRMEIGKTLLPIAILIAYGGLGKPHFAFYIAT